MMKRAVRILPLYWLMTAVAILMVAYKPWLLPKAELSDRESESHRALASRTSALGICAM